MNCVHKKNQKLWDTGTTMKTNNHVLIGLLAILFGTLLGKAFPEEKRHEKDYQIVASKKFDNAKIEHILPDKTRIDILTDKEAIEVDWASKWAEGIGQSLHYSTMTGKEAGLILILKKPDDSKYVARVKHILLIKSLKINLYTIDANLNFKKVN